MTEDKKHPLVIEGSGGGKKEKKQRPPVEAPNTLQSAATGRILDLLAYGPIEGVIGGAKGVFLDGTPIQNENGTFNFEGVTVEFRNGAPDQDMIKGFTDVSNVREVNTEIRLDAPVVRSISNMDATSAIVTIRINALYSRNSSTGDTNGASVPIAIEVEKSGAWTRAVSDNISGKTMSAYERSYRINLPEGGTGATNIRVSRLNKESDTQDKGDSIAWSKLTEVVDVKQNYPGCALVGIEVDARQFANTLPSRQYLAKLSIIQVPTNYDPISRTYTGIWNGQFKWAWSDNPAWCFYDIASHPVIGANIKNINKFYLYELGKYCDELVDDGYGGKEPRFTFNTILSSPEDAITVFNTLTSVFRGMAYWGSDSVEVVADMPGPIRRQITPSDVIEGEFTYQGTALKERHSVAVVMWNDPENNYDQVPEIVELPEAIELLGYKEVEVTAVACTSRGQARRLGLWILYSEFYETQTANFTTTVKNADFRPGDYFELLDPYRAGARLGGKVLKLDGVKVTLDAVPSEVSKGWTITLEKEDKGLERFAINSVNENVLTLAKSPVGVLSNSNFALSNPDLGARQFRVVSVVETENHNYSITASEHNPGKYDFVEKGLKLPEKPTSLLPKGGLPQPTGLSAEVFTRVQGGTLHMNATVSWTVEEDPRLDLFVLDVKGPTDFSYRTVYTGSGLSVDLQDIEPGQWSFRVKATSTEWGNSPWFQKTLTLADLLQPLPPQRLEISTTSFTATIIPVQQRYSISDYEFWRSDVALKHGEIESNAMYLGQGLTFVDTGLKFDTEYFYYVRAVNAYGKSTWVAGQAKTQADVEDILEAVFDEANKGEIGQWLQEEIGKIDLQGKDLEDISEKLSAVESELEDKTTALESAVDGANKKVDDLATSMDEKLSDLEGSLEGTNQKLEDGLSSISKDVDQLHNLIDSISNAPEYQEDKEYLAGSLVKSEGVLWSAKQDVPAGTPLAEGEFWEKVGNYTSIVDAVGALSEQASLFENSIKELDGELTATNSMVSSVRTAFLQDQEGRALEAVDQWRSMAEASQELTAQSDAHSSVVRRLSTLTATVGDNLAKLITLEEVMVTEFDAVAKQITALSSALGEKADASAVSELTTKVSEIEGNVTSQSQSITKLESGLEATDKKAQQGVDDAKAAQDTANKKADATALQSLDTKVSEIEGNVTSQSQSITKLESGLEATDKKAQQGVDDAKAAQDTANKKADATALQSLDTKVSEIEGNVTSQSQSITKLESGLEATDKKAQQGVDDAKAAQDTANKKADATALQSLDTKVSEIEGNVTSQSQSITKLESGLEATDKKAQQGVDDAKAAQDTANKKADATALQSLDTKVSEIEGNVSSQSQSITKLESGLEATDKKAQKGIDDAKAAQETANKKADATALQSLDTKVSEIEGDVTSQSQSITKLESGLEATDKKAQQGIDDAKAAQETANKKADATALQSLDTKVSEIEGNVTSQSQSITKLESGLEATDKKAQQGVDDAKAAQDTANKKADATALQSLDTKVSEIEGNVSSQSQSITKLESGLEATDKKAQKGIDDAKAAQETANKKADATALQSLDTKVSEIEGDVTSQSQSITKLESSLETTNNLAQKGVDDAASAHELASKKADATAVQALDTKVTQQGEDIASQSQSVTSLKAAIDALPNTGVNLLGAEASMAATMDGTSTAYASRELLEVGSGVGALDVAIKFKPNTENKVALFRYARSANTWANVVGDKNYIISAYVFSPINKRLQILGVTANSETNPPWFNRYPAEASERFPEITGGEWTRVSAVVNAPKDGVILGMTIYINQENSPISEENFLLISRVMVEQQVGDNRIPSPWVPGKADAVLNANASALEVLDAQVSEIEGNVTSQSQSITKLESGLEATDKKAQQGVDDAKAAQETANKKADATALQSLDTKVSEIDGKVEAHTTSLTQLSSAVDNNASAIQNEASTRANETSSLATRIETIEANVGEELGAQIEEIKDAQVDLSGKMSSAWGVKLQVNNNGEYVTAGVGMDITSEGGVTQSNFIVQANNFIVQDGLNGAGQAAFAVSNGKVIIRSALVGDASITNAKIANAAITTAKIKDAEITSAKIKDAAITTAKIGNAQISNAKIANAAVDTLKIAGRAVTLPASSYTSANREWSKLNESWITVQSLSISVTGGSAILSCSFVSTQVSDAGRRTRHYARLIRGGTVLWESEVHFFDEFVAQNVSMTIEDVPPAGLQVYQLQLRASRPDNNQSYDVSNSIIYFSEFKR